MKKVIQFESFSSLYNENLQHELLKSERFNKNFELEIINFDKVRSDYIREMNTSNNKSIISKIFFWLGFNRYLKNRFRYLKGSILHIQYVSPVYIGLYPFIFSIFSSVVLSYWGSDLLREKKTIHFMLKPLVYKSKYITVETETMKNIFLEKFGRKYASKIQIVKFGISVLNLIDDIEQDNLIEFVEKYKIDTNRKCITIGYNRNLNHQHYDVIKSIDKYAVDKNKIFLIFPWTYGPEDVDYKKKIVKELNGKYDYVFLENRLTDIEIASLRKITSILVQVQTTDSFSSTMLETLYACNEVLTGNWLPYDDLLESGVTMRLVDSVEKVGSCLNDMLEHPLNEDKKAKNKRVISHISSWKENVDKWIDLYA